MNSNPSFRVSNKSESQPGLLRRLLQWLMALFRSVGPSGPTEPRNPTGPRQSDGFVEGLLADVARQLAPKLEIPETELAATFKCMRQGETGGKPASKVVRVDCTLAKETASRVKVSVQVLHRGKDKPLITTLEKAVSWDDLPQEVRSQFIRTGGRELHYVLCESQSNRQQ